MLDELLAKWQQHSHLIAPPPEPVLLAQAGARTVYIEEGWGPPVPYPPAPREGGSMNHGYKRLKGNLDTVLTVPEVEGWPEYAGWLRTLNADSSPIESVGCEKCFFPFDQGDAKAKLGTYTDVMFSDISLNDDPVNHLRLAAHLESSLDGSEQWWSVAEFGLQRMKGLSGCRLPWGLMIRVIGHGRAEDEARQTWAESIRRLSEAVSRLSPSFPG